VSILLFQIAGQSASGILQAAVVFSSVVGYSFSLAFALYPKMLAEDCPNDVTSSFKAMIMLALPMATIAAVMARSLLTILNESYAYAYPVLMLLAVDALIALISQFYLFCLMGVEKFDMEGKISIRELVRSKIFKVFTLPYIQAAISIPLVYYILTQVGFGGDTLKAVLYVVAVGILVHIVVFVGIYWRMRSEVRIFVAWKSVAKYVLCSLATAAVLLVLPTTTTLTMTFGKLLVGAATYFGLLLAIDKDARKLARQIWAEIRRIFRKPEHPEVTSECGGLTS
jgi:hypothetical protein